MLTANTPETLTVKPEDAGQRLDQFLASNLKTSRARVQELIAQAKVLVNDGPAKASLKLRAEHKLRLTRTQLLVCSSSSCPGRGQ